MKAEPLRCKVVWQRGTKGLKKALQFAKKELDCLEKYLPSRFNRLYRDEFAYGYQEKP
jgi:hypothetical protein